MQKWAVLLVSALAGCGGLNGRAFELEVRGLSARASELVLKVQGPTTLTPCRDINLSNAASVAADDERRWVRSENGARAFELPALEVDTVVLIAYSTDAAGMPIQFACQQFGYADLGNLVGGRVVLTLSRRQ